MFIRPIVAVLGCILTCSVFADGTSMLNPFFTLDVGTSISKIGENQTVVVLSPFDNFYEAERPLKHEINYGFSFGGQYTLNPELMVQLGLGYYRTQDFTAQGVVDQFHNFAYDNLNYEYKVKHQRIVIQSQVMTTMWDVVHPYVSANIGDGINSATGYNETPRIPSAVPMTPFADKRTQSLAMGIGTGVQFDLTQHIRLGLGYRFEDMGKARLGVSPAQNSSDTISAGNLYAHEVHAQFSLIG